MHEGFIIKAYGGYYYVQVGLDVWECSLRGRLRLEKRQILVGDRVQARWRHGLVGVIEKVLPRRSVFSRPPVANVGQAVVVFAFKEPEPNPWLLDRLLVLAATEGVGVQICFNKLDLSNGGRDQWLSRYRLAGYQVIATSARTGAGVDVLAGALAQQVSVFAGPSGVGKSSLLNFMQPGLFRQIGEISARVKRGKHTTRHIELLPLENGGLVADTPGFSSLDLPLLKPEQLSDFFPEMDKYRPACRFTGCLHFNEPDCAIKEALRNGKIDALRYQNYLSFLQELKEKRRSF
ncbi:MAG: ribosome small subunit-dependent GTPase A [Peptococcaceae bacterium]|nr:MAG: ribosome small subunit-dependent GTPase A [Peptococcaceae bacterium]